MKDKDKIELRNPAAIAAFAAGDLDNAIVASTPGGIQRQEREGQQALLASLLMPRKLSPNQAAFEKVGFIFSELMIEDPLFVRVTLPAGWSRKGSDHAMHSTIVDAQGRERVSVFYKAAFYDRRANASLLRRYTTGTAYAGMEGGEGLAKNQVRYTLLDAGKPFHVQADCPNYGPERDVVEATIMATLDKLFPNHLDPVAYWDDPPPAVKTGTPWAI